jgi:hypothetical protein
MDHESCAMSLERNPRVATFPETADYFLRMLGTVIPFRDCQYQHGRLEPIMKYGAEMVRLAQLLPYHTSQTRL